MSFPLEACGEDKEKPKRSLCSLRLCGKAFTFIFQSVLGTTKVFKV